MKNNIVYDINVKNSKIILYNDDVNTFFEQDFPKNSLILTDPPFGIDIDEWDKFDNWYDFTKQWLSNIKNINYIYIWISQQRERSFQLYNIFKELNWNFQSEIVHQTAKTSAKKSCWPINEQRIQFWSKDKYKFIPQESNIKKKVSYGKFDDRNKWAGTIWSSDDIVGIWFRHKERVEGIPVSVQKPIEANRRLIRSIDNIDYVIEPFCGGGSTILSAIYEGKNVIANDISINNINLVAERLKSI